METLARSCAQAQGIENLDPSVASTIAPDVEYHIRSVIQDGLKFMTHAKRNTLTTDDINAALRVRNIEGMYGFSGCQESTPFSKISEDLFMLKSKEESFRATLAAPLPKCPVAPSFAVHWLAVEGVQPKIAPNPTTTEPKRKKLKTGSTQVDADDQEVKILVKHVLSQELQLYYEKTTEAILTGDEKQQNMAYLSLAEDPGLHQLTPYLTQFIAEQVTLHLRKLPLLMSLMRTLRALLKNPHLQLELYLHQLLPSIFTCLVGRRLCSKPTEDHWALRNYAASLIAFICQLYGPSYSTMQPRITKTLHDAFASPKRPLTTHYGGIVGISHLGPIVVELLLLPGLASYVERLQPLLASEHGDPVQRMEAQHCYCALLAAAGNFLKYKTGSSEVDGAADAGDAPSASLSELYSVFGESLLPYVAGLNQGVQYNAQIVKVTPAKPSRPHTLSKLSFIKKDEERDRQLYTVKHKSGHVQRLRRSQIVSPAGHTALQQGQQVQIQSLNYFELFI